MKIRFQDFLFKLSLEIAKKEMPGYPGFHCKKPSEVKVDSGFLVCKKEKQNSAFTT